MQIGRMKVAYAMTIVRVKRTRKLDYPRVKSMVRCITVSE